MSASTAFDSLSPPPIDRPSEEVAEQQRWWREQWLAFPSVSERPDGALDFWSVAPDSGVYAQDWPRGERLAAETIEHMQRFPEGASVLRRILRRLDHESTVAQGFLNRIEDALSRPEVYLATPRFGLPGH